MPTDTCVAVTGCGRKERLKTIRRVLKSGCISVERLIANSRVLGAVDGVKERAIIDGCVVVAAGVVAVSKNREW